MSKIISFTGHRPNSLGGYNVNDPLNLKIIAALQEAIVKQIQKGNKRFISGGALGVDQWAAVAVLHAKTRLHQKDVHLTIARPFPEQDAVWPNRSKDEFRRICKMADVVTDVSPGPYAAWKMQKRNEWMVDNSDIVIAVFNGSAGGTANCVNYAKQKGKEIILINPKELVDKEAPSIGENSHLISRDSQRERNIRNNGYNKDFFGNLEVNDPFLGYYQEVPNFGLIEDDDY